MPQKMEMFELRGREWLWENLQEFIRVNSCTPKSVTITSDAWTRLAEHEKFKQVGDVLVLQGIEIRLGDKCEISG